MFIDRGKKLALWRDREKFEDIHPMFATAFIMDPRRETPPLKHLASKKQNLKREPIFQAILEGFVDGVIVLNHRGEFLHANHKACVLCEQLPNHSSLPYDVPEDIWRVCEALLDSRDCFPRQRFAIESEVSTIHETSLRLRGRWFQLVDSDPPYLLIVLEDRQQSIQQQAIADKEKYGLTRREAEVWALRRAHHSYKAIAAKLYISENTVKKHMKNINAKRQAVMWAEEDRN
ncbi:helix-turn-helix transcriptional regulator [Lusitaniella coriacea]|uniref:helix-turn-helix transcriptional regulator n=1 Tax=Lusitaniella coriacea TaxID=1983105 RepID=UPI003CF57D5C